MRSKNIIKVIRKVCCMKLVVAILLSISANVHAQEVELAEAAIYVDGEPIKTKYILKEGHLFVPAVFFKNTGAFVDWSNQFRSTVFRSKEKMFALPVGKNVLDTYEQKSNMWKQQTIPQGAIEINKVPFVPLVTVATALGMGVSYDEKTARTYVTSNISVKPNSFRQGSSGQKLVALTFDDGPESFYTPKILDVLKEKGVHATFFMMGKQVQAHPDVVRRIVAEGHAIGNHTWDHPDLRRAWSNKVIEQIRKTQNQIEKVTGRRPDLFRPPYGAVTKADIIVLNEMGLRNMMWSVDTEDWRGLSGTEITEIVNRDIFPGAIVLQHNFQTDSATLDGTVEALPKMIDDLREKGYQFVTLQTMLEYEK